MATFSWLISSNGFLRISSDFPFCCSWFVVLDGDGELDDIELDNDVDIVETELAHTEVVGEVDCCGRELEGFNWACGVIYSSFGGFVSPFDGQLREGRW